MKTTTFVAAVVAAVAVGWVGRSVFSDDPPKPAGGSEQEAWAKLATPGPQHARLMALAGDWVTHAKMMGPDGKMQESDGTASFTAILGGRYLEEKSTGTMWGMPFEGRGLVGYDNAKKKFVSCWIDNFGTGIMRSEGDEKEEGKVWIYKGSFTGPDGDVAMRMMLTKVSDTELKNQMFMGDSPDPMFTLTYKRK